jgi:CubicO group peptidase (beta-lactamase class C family)
MLDENLELRAQKAPLKVFVERICQVKPLFKPGTRISYQSAGIAMLGEIVERLEGVRLRDFLRQEVFDPLGLGDTSLGMQEDRRDRISQVRIPGGKFEFGASEADYNWNSDYWLSFGAPWGGMLTTVGDMTVLCQLFLNGGHVGDVRILSPSTVAGMTSDQTSSVPDFPGRDRFAQRWGLGWHLRGLNSDRFGGLDVTGPVHWFDSAFGDLTSDATYGHMGATGTVVWIDPEYDVACVLFTNDPQGADPLRFRVSNAVAGSLANI